MEPPAIGSIVLVKFPFSDLSGSKKRPALVLATAAWDDPMLCQITGQQSGDPTAIEILASDIEGGSLERRSFARSTKIFTASPILITRVIGTLHPAKFGAVLDSLVTFLLAAKNAKR
ncbi:MAG: type II toxin-antitoxin system PemK/MazF family toxin [Candidatus Kapaibacterium sp.]